MQWLHQDVEAVEYLRNEVLVIYHRMWKKLDCFLRNHELVFIVSLCIYLS